MAKKNNPIVQIDYSYNSGISQWYTIITMFNYENCFVETLLNKIKNNPFAYDDVEDIFIPQREFFVEHVSSSGKISTKKCIEKVMSLYVFIKMKLSEALYMDIKNITGCVAFLAIGNALSALNEEEINKIRENCRVTKNTYRGEKITMAYDPFENLLDTIR